MRQHILQLFSEDGQWVSLIDVNELLEPSDSDLCNSIQAMYEPGTQPPLEIPMKDPAIWLGKYAGLSYTCTACLEGYTKCALAKMAHSDASHLGKHLHKMAKTRDCPSCKKAQLDMSRQLDKELSAITLTNQLSATAGSSIMAPPSTTEEGSTEMWPAPAPYNDGDVLMGEVSDKVTDKLYGD